MAGRIGLPIRLVAASLILAALGAAAAQPKSDSRVFPPAATPANDRVRAQYGRLPLSFEQNVGQTDPHVEFIARGGGYTMFLTQGAGAVLALSSPQSESTAVVRLTPVGADRTARARGRAELPGKVNYLLTSDHARWRTGIATFASVAFEDVYPGIDVVYYGNQRQFEYDFVVSPGINPRTIALAVAGAERLEIDAAGDLVMSVGGRELRQRKPNFYQEMAGSKKAVGGHYRIDADQHVSFEIGNYDASRPLVIDPTLVYSTYLGGAISNQAIDGARDVAIDAQGHAYLTGSTVAADFPTTSGGFNRPAGFDSSVYVTKFNAAGTALVYSTLLGGSANDKGAGITVDAAGNAYVTGSTQSADFPVTAGAFDTSFNSPGDDSDAFVTKLDAAGTSLVYSTFLGGYEGALPADTEQGVAIAVDAQGHAYVTGVTGRDFPTTDGAFARSADDRHNGFVTKFDPAGATLVYSTLLGDSAQDHLRDIAIDAAGNAFVTGLTQSRFFPTTPGAFDTDNNGGGFITKLDQAGASLLYSTFLDGASINSIAVDGSGNAYVTGAADRRLPITPGVFDNLVNGPLDAFVTKINASGAALVYSTFLGGDSASAIAVNTGGSVYVTGTDVSGDVPVTPGAFSSSINGDSDAFVAALDSLGATLVYATYLGGSGRDEAAGIAVDAAGAAFVVGSTSSSDFPTTTGGFDTSVGHRAGFVSKISMDGAALLYSSFLGGTLLLGGHDNGVAVAVDANGSAYLAGSTMSIDFPTTSGAFDRTGEFLGFGSSFVFVTKLDPTGATANYSTYLGPGSARGIAIDSGGHAYVAGSTSLIGFPTTPGAFDRSLRGTDAFVTKLNPSGTGLIYSTFLGGDRNDVAFGIAVDASGSAYVTGITDSYPEFKVLAGFPITEGAFDINIDRAFVPDAFVTKFNATGSALVYSTVLGGGGPDFGLGIAVDAVGMAYVTGLTASADFPTTPGAVDTDIGGADAFVTKLNAKGSALAYSTFLGGNGEDAGWAIAVDAVGRAYVTGFTHSDDFPTASAIDSGWNGSYDGFVTQLDATGGALVYSTYLGGSDADFGYGIALDSGGTASLTGMTLSADFPTTDNALDRTLDGIADAFVVTVDVTGSALTHSSYLGGGDGDAGMGIAVDQAGDVYVTGATASSDFPTTAGAFDTTGNISIDAFVTKLTDGSMRPALTLTPPIATTAVGDQHCVTATVLSASRVPLPGLVVRVFTTGANSAAGSAETDANGQGHFCYTGRTIGTDAIVAFVDIDRDGMRDAGEPTRAAMNLYTTGPPVAVTIQPGEDSNPLGQVHCVAAFVEDRFRNPIVDITLRFTVHGVVETSGTAASNVDGWGVFCYRNDLLWGQDSIHAYADRDGDSTQDADEPGGSATAVWQIPPSSLECGSVRGQGLLFVNGQWASFVLTQERPIGQENGGIEYRVPAAGIYFASAIILSIGIDSGHQATLHGVMLSGAEGTPFRIEVVDGGDVDTFRIVWPGYAPFATAVVLGQIVVTTCN